jgi:NADH dehydrogenase FAD-containing subunit
VDRNLKAAPGIYVLGDSAMTKYSGMAQTAVYDGQFIADYLRGNKYAYRPKQPIAAIPVGKKWCAVAVGRVTFYGRMGWFVRRYLDFKLYCSILPIRTAWRIWLYGRQTDEACPVCHR